MKKIFFLFVLLFVVFFAFAVTAADWTFPGWKCTDTVKIQAALDSAPLPVQKAMCAILLKQAQMPPANFAALAAQIDEVGAQYALSPAQVIGFKKQYPYCQGRFIEDAWTFCKANPTDYDLYYLNRDASKLGYTSAQLYAVLLDKLLVGNFNAALTKSTVGKLIDLAVAADVPTAKADLQKLNRKLSKNLLVDKTAWEPVIAQIRTTIETY